MGYRKMDELRGSSGTHADVRNVEMQEQVRLIHVTAELPPTVGGVADYSVILTRRLVKESSTPVEPVFIRAGRTERREDPKIEYPVRDLHERTSTAALAGTIGQLEEGAEGAVVVLLEYSGYGYAKRGAPLWLARGLRRVCGQGKIPLVTVFHEISASGPFWSSAFWLAPLQRWISKTLLRLSRAALVNRPHGAKQLKEWSNGSPEISFRSVFSNVGEPEERVPFDDRDRYAVAFGGADEKDTLYAHSDQLRRIFEASGIDRVIDIGTPPKSSPSLPVQHDVLGVQSAETVGRWLQRARIGLAHRRLDLLPKSGVVVAYLAHGVPPVVLPNGTTEHPPVLSHGRHYVDLKRTGAQRIDWEEVSRHGYAWYQEHAHSQNAARDVLRAIHQAV